MRRNIPLQGQSLAPFIMGQEPPQPPREFAVSQMVKCVEHAYLTFDPRARRAARNFTREDERYLFLHPLLWEDCFVHNKTSTLQVTESLCADLCDCAEKLTTSD